jgi:hypothetical protein
MGRCVQEFSCAPAFTKHIAFLHDRTDPSGTGIKSNSLYELPGNFILSNYHPDDGKICLSKRDFRRIPASSVGMQEFT